MKKTLILFFIIITSLYSFDFKNYNTFEELKKDLENLDIHKKIEFETISLLNTSKIEDAKFLFSLLKSAKLENNPIENALLIPKNCYALIVSKNRQKLIVIENRENSYEKVLELPCITGKRQGDKFEKGDKKTPNGVYFAKFFIPEEKLSKTYGKGAFPLNYPNIIDKKIFKKSGNGIWIHATDNDNRKPFSSNGCIVLTNKNFLKLKEFINIKKTPVVIVDDFSKIEKNDFINNKISLGYFIYSWKKSWESSINGKIDKYLLCYSKNLVSRYGDFKEFKKHKENVAKNKKWIDIDIKNLYLTKDGRVLNYGHIYVAIFDMIYKSNNYNWSGKKILYIIKEKDRWKILAEENL